MLKRNLLNFGLKALLAIVFFNIAQNSRAVTDAEMDEARAIAAKFYIRYANNGSGYLDGFTPASMSDLEKKLTNNTDKENLAKFKSAGLPKDYSSWDKDQLVAYWSNTFFTDHSSSLGDAAKNGECKKKIRSAVQNVKVTPPAPAAPAVEPTPETPAVEEAATVPPEETMATEEEIEETVDQIAEAESQLAADQGLPREEENGSGTWVYIMVLAILVVIVIGLVIYASRTMKGQKKDEDDDLDEIPLSDPHLKSDSSAYAPQALPVEEPVAVTDAPLVAPAPQTGGQPSPTKLAMQAATGASIAEQTRMREKYAETLAAKSEEIRSLSRQLSDMEMLAAQLKEENRRLTAEVDRLRNLNTPEAPSPRAESLRQEEKREEEVPRPPKREQDVKEVYLGRVNSKGIFVRADRHAVDGQSIYKLTTSNGISGTFALLQNPLIIEQVLDDPGRWLAGGCFAKDIFDTEGREEIITETPGTAAFRDGAWRVEKKSRIRYE